MSLDQKYTAAFTLVFKGDIREFGDNPFKVDSPWGRPYAAALGDIIEEADKLKDEVENFREAEERRK